MHPGRFSTRKPENLTSQRAREIFRLKSRSGKAAWRKRAEEAGGNHGKRSVELFRPVPLSILSLCLFPPDASYGETVNTSWRAATGNHAAGGARRFTPRRSAAALYDALRVVVELRSVSCQC